MTEAELRRALSLMSTNYNKPLDENIIALWKGLFIEFDAYFFNKACLILVSSSKFFPNAAEIIDAYRRVKSEVAHERREKAKANQKMLVDDQAYCYLCRNTGYCYYSIIPEQSNEKSSYMLSARCICVHGRDLNVFSESQTDKAHIPEVREYYSGADKALIKRGKNPFYLSTIKEVLGEDFVIYDAQMREIYISNPKLRSKEIAEFLKKCGNQGMPDTIQEMQGELEWA